jgi:hypothetical protein
MAPLPDVVKQLSESVKWTTDLGNAFLAQQSDVMDAVQRMRVKAKGAGNLKSTEQQKVETKTVENKTVVVIEQAQPQVPAITPQWFTARRFIRIHRSPTLHPELTSREWPFRLALEWQWGRPGGRLGVQLWMGPQQ